VSRGHYTNQIGRSSLGPRGRGGFPRVGITLFHSSEDADNAAREINTAFEQLVDAMYRAMGADPALRKLRPDQAVLLASTPAGNAKLQTIADMKKSPFYGLWQTTVSPLYEEWRHRSGPSFTDDVLKHATGGLLFGNDIDEYKRWQQRVGQAYVAAKAAGVPNLPPPSIPLSDTALEQLYGAAKKGAGGIGDLALDLGGAVKVLAYGAIGLGGIFLVTQLVQASKKDGSR
jgi:hypothetical protein